MKVSVSNVSFRYSGASTVVFGDLNLSVDQGCLCAICGPNGAGKSTLLDILAGWKIPQKGRVSIESTVVEYLPQDYARGTFPWQSAAWNICLPLILRNDPRLDVDASKWWFGRRKLMKQRLNELARRFTREFGIELPVENFGYQLSGGQTHLLAILRTLVASPDLLLLDEPDAGLDAGNFQKLWQILENYLISHPSAAIICTTHSAAHINVRHKLMQLNKGGRLETI